MLLRQKVKRRLKIAGAVFFVCAAACVVVYVWRDRLLESTVQQGFVEGLELLEAKQYEPALHKIGRYVQRHPNSPAALEAYAKARMQVPLPNNRHLSDALGFLRRALGQDANRESAAKELLNLYLRVGFHTEAIEFADRVLKVRPSDGEALRVRAVSLLALRRFENGQALNAAHALVKNSPNSLFGHLVVLEVLSKGDQSSARLRDYSKQLRSTRSEDAHSIVISAIAADYAGEMAVAKKWCTHAVLMNINDFELAAHLQKQCDRLGMYDEATLFIERYSGSRAEPAAQRLLASRLFERERYAEIFAKVLDGRVPPDRQTRALAALAAYERKDRKTFDEQVATLRSHGTVAMPEPWCRILTAMYGAGDAHDGEIIRGCQEVLARDLDNPYALLILAEAYARVGENDDALQSLRRATEFAPAWSKPYVLLSRASMSLGRPADARRTAEAAVARNGSSPSALLALATAKVADIKPGNPELTAEVSTLLDQVDRLAGAEEPWRSSPIRAQVFAAAGDRNGAAALVKRVLASDQRPPATTLMHLSSVSRAFDLGLDQEALARCQQLHGLSPELGFIQAKTLLDAGKTEEGLAILDGGQLRADSADRLAWTTNRARYLELAHDSRAKTAWIELADANPHSAKLQWLAVSSQAVQSDRAFVGKALDRLREQLGNEGLAWRIARAQWLLDGPDSQAAVQAALILNDITRGQPDLLAPRLLLADCLLRLHSESGAIEQLTAATELQPQSVPIALKLAQLLNSRGDTARARIHIDRILTNPIAKADERRIAAQMLASSGDSASALQAMERSTASGVDTKDPRTALFLAQLYWSAAQPQKVETLCSTLLNTPTAESIAFVADYYAATGRASDAQAVLGKLDATSISPATKALVRGQFEVQFGDKDKGLEALAEATRIDPKNPVPWKALIRANAALRKASASASVAATAVAAIPEDPGVQAFQRRANAMQSLSASWPEVLELCVELLNRPERDENVATVLDELRLLQAPSNSIEVADRVAKLAGRYDQLVPLQKLAARSLLSAHKPSEAALLASRAMNLSPDDPRIAEMASVAYAAAGRWEDVLRTAEEWRRRLPGNPLPADVLLGTAYLRLHQGERTKQQLNAYATLISSDPSRYMSVATLLAYAHLSSGNVADAEKLLIAHIKLSSEYRISWIQIAGTAIPDRALALRWLSAVEPLCDAQSGQEVVCLSQAYMLIANRSREKADLQAAKRFADQVFQLKNVPAFAYTSVGQIEEGCGDFAAAEKAYRQAITLGGKDPVAQNNLAMILLSQKRDLGAAIDFARAAASATGPNRSEYLDTLASIQLEQGLKAEASKTLESAIQLAPNRADWHLKQIRWQMAAGDRRAAQASARSLQRKPIVFATLSAEARREVEAVSQ